MKFRTLTCISAMILLTAVVPLLDSRTIGGDANAVIAQLENDGVKADLAKDTSWTKKNLVDDFIAATSFGKWETKASRLKDAEDPANNHYNRESLSDLKVNAYGNAAIARYTVAYDAVVHGEHRARTVICTDTWVKQGKAWKEVGQHCSQAE
jgi:hypothetical protein